MAISLKPGEGVVKDPGEGIYNDTECCCNGILTPCCDPILIPRNLIASVDETIAAGLACPVNEIPLEYIGLIEMDTYHAWAGSGLASIDKDFLGVECEDRLLYIQMLCEIPNEDLRLRISCDNTNWGAEVFVGTLNCNPFEAEFSAVEEPATGCASPTREYVITVTL